MKKITMVNPEQICARGWKGLKTKSSVQNFATKYRVNRVWWKASATRKVMLIDPAHFQEAWKEYKTTTAKSTTKASTRKQVTGKSTTKTTAKKRTTTRVSTRKPVAKTRTTTTKPKARKTVTRRTRKY
jgi:hypothetical protein